MNFKKLKPDVFTARLAFLLSLTVYLLSTEPSVSLWDCGEFIAAAYKLQIPHPPGAPFYLLLGRVFSLFAPDAASVAFAVNALSAFASAFTVFFLVKIIQLLLGNSQLKNKSKNILAFSGALLFAFTDTFWFSAVEAEVYALSIFFTALCLWLILKWRERKKNDARADRYLFLIALLTGLSVGVHLLNLLIIPALVYVWYLDKPLYGSRFSIAKIFGIGIAALFVVQFVLLKGSVWLAGVFELIAVNDFGFKYHSGLLAFVVFVILTIAAALYFTYKKKAYFAHKLVMITALLLLGFSVYFIVIIRSSASPPINENSPDNIFALESYLNRDQYGSNPLVWGTYYDADYARDKDGLRLKSYSYKFTKENGKYLKIKKKIPKYHFRNGYTIFPRMHSRSGSHKKAYRLWGGIEKGESPNFLNNLRFFASYQVGQMYFRYLLWNYSGRQNDKLGHGHFRKGNFLTGFPVIDEIMTGNEKKLPEKSKSRNVYFLIPFLLGILGIIYQIKHDKKNFWFVFSIFLFTGLAIVVFLNQEPYQARERDYAYVGSFMAYAVWVTYGVLSLMKFIGKKANQKIADISLITIALALPLWVFIQNWDDHNRSGRYIVRDVAKDYLKSCAPGAILFTDADNDTFPLWYLQQVEGFRTDVRVVNLSLLNASWYIDALLQKADKSDAFSFLLGKEKYREGRHEVNHVYPNADKIERFGIKLYQDSFINLKDALLFLSSEEDSAKFIVGKEKKDFIPSRRVCMPFKGDTSRMMKWQIGSNFLLKSDLAVLDIIVSNFPERPVHFSRSVSDSDLLGLKAYCEKSGLTYRLTGKKSETGSVRVSAQKQYDFLADSSFYKKTPADALVNYDITRFLRMTKLKNIYGETIRELLNSGDTAKALEIAGQMQAVFPSQKFVYDESFDVLPQTYRAAGKLQKADTIAQQINNKLKRELEYINSLSPHFYSFMISRKKQIKEFLE